MDKKQMQKERDRLQAALEAYRGAPGLNGRDEDSAPAPESHPRLVERIAQLDRRIAEAYD